MDNNPKRTQALRVLELEGAATWPDIEEAYQRLLARYSSQSLASYGLLRLSDRHKLLEAIGKAYLRLSQQRYNSKPPGAPPSTPAPPSGYGNIGNPGTPSGVSSLSPEKRTGPPPMEQPDVDSKRSTLWESSSPEGSSLAKAPVRGKVATMLKESAPSQTNGGLLWKARAAHSMAVEELAQRLGCSQDMLLRLESRQYDDFESSRQLRKVVEAYASVVGLQRQQTVTEILSDFWKWRAKRRKSS